jgi:hypothetical protein
MRLVIFFLAILSLSCSKNSSNKVGKPQTEPVMISSFKNFYEHDHAMIANYEVYKNNSFMNYKYYDDGLEFSENLLYMFSINSIKKTLLYHGHECQFLKSTTYELSYKEYKIHSFYYNIIDQVDEENTIYFSDDYGPIILYNNGWQTIAAKFQYDSISNELATLILADTTNQFPRSVRPGYANSEQLEISTGANKRCYVKQ